MCILRKPETSGGTAHGVPGAVSIGANYFVFFDNGRCAQVGFGAGFLIAAFWNHINLFVNTFFKAGLQQLSTLVRTGQIQRPELLIAVIAVAGHFLLILGCIAGFLRMRPSIRRWGEFAASGLLAVSYFITIIITTGPQYIRLLKRVFGL